MNRHPQNDPDQDPKNDPAWDLLLEARKVEVSPFFARNVLREVRLADSEKEPALSGWRSILSLQRLLTGAAAAAAAIVVAIILVNGRNDLSPANSSPIAQTAQTAQTAQETKASAPVDKALPAVEHVEAFDISDYEDEIEMIDYLDGLLAAQDVSALDDEALSELLF